MNMIGSLQQRVRHFHMEMMLTTTPMLIAPMRSPKRAQAAVPAQRRQVVHYPKLVAMQFLSWNGQPIFCHLVQVKIMHKMCLLKIRKSRR